MMLLSLILSFLCCIVLARLVGIGAVSYSVISASGSSRWSSRPIPLWGGLSILCSVIVPLATVESETNEIIWLIVTVLFLCVGFADDIFRLRYVSKLAWQMIAATLSAVILGIPFFSMDFIITVCWIVLITNAFNLIDGMDGLAISYAVIIFLWCQWSLTPTILHFCFLGACLGFLPYNYTKASLYLGDSGSHILGAAIAVITLPSVLAGGAGLPSYSLLIPLSLPLCDICFVSITRKLRRLPITSRGTDHIPHRLARLIGERRAVALLLAYTIILAALSIASGEWSLSGQHNLSLIVVSINIILIIILQQKTRRFFKTGSQG